MIKVDMEKWMNSPLKEQIKLNKEHGFTVDDVFGINTQRRKDFEEMVEKSMKEWKKYFDKKKENGEL